MGSVNKVVLVGHLGADPELKFTGTGKAVCNLRLATTETWKDKGGQKQEKTEWHRIAIWGDTAENCAKYLAKGRLVYVEGKLQTRSYDKDGQKHYATDIVSERVVFLSSGRDGSGQRDVDDSSEPSHARRGGGGGSSAVGRNVEQPPGSAPPVADDDIPFIREE